MMTDRERERASSKRLDFGLYAMPRPRDLSDSIDGW